MVHLHTQQYPALRSFYAQVRKELITKNLDKSISEELLLTGQDSGFCKDEIKEIIDVCYEELTRLKPNYTYSFSFS